MQIEFAHVLAAIGIGIGATLLMDVWNQFLKRAFNLPSLDYCMLGRWLRHMPQTFQHTSIAAAPPKSKECVVGWLAHYSIGISLALVFVMLMSGAWLERPTLVPALLYGIATVAFPFLVMQPSLGLGIASSKVPKPRVARIKSLATHTVYGLGMYVWALGFNLLSPV